MNQLIADRDGSAGLDMRYDGSGNVVLSTTVGPDEKPVSTTVSGVTTIANQFDARNRLTVQRFMGDRGHPARSDDGVFVKAYAYDGRDLKVEMRFLDVSGALMNDNNGGARIEYDYDTGRALIEERCFDSTALPCKGEYAAAVRHRNDPYGREVERTYHDAAGNFIVSPISGRWKAVFVRDEFGRAVIERSFGIDGLPIDRRDTGWSTREFHYGDSWQEVKVVCRDRRGANVAKCSAEG